MSRPVRLSVALTLAAAACAPNNAKLVDGEYIAFLSAGTSLSLAKELVPLDKYDTHYQIDCREFETKEEEDALRLPNAVDYVCKGNKWPPEYESWQTEAGFEVVTEKMDPWRGEAVITAEGDLQIGFHHRIPGGADMRFEFTVDPDFAPQTCIIDENGKTKHVPKDGDWIENWSAETLGWMASSKDKYPEAFAHIEPYMDGKLYFLNARSYQYNPVDSTLTSDWDIPPEWTAGTARGKFVEELLFPRTARYGDPRLYNAIELSGSSETTYGGFLDDFELWYCEVPACEEGVTTTSPGGASECALPEDHDGQTWWVSECADLQDDAVHDVASDVHKELVQVMTPVEDGAPVFDYAPLAHLNYWREPDGLAPGFDGWGELHYNYVVFDKDSVLEEGGSAKGAFSLLLDSDQSSTRVILEGQFEIEKIKKDKWTTSNLQRDKLIEAGQTLCNAASPDDANPSE